MPASAEVGTSAGGLFKCQVCFYDGGSGPLVREGNRAYACEYGHTCCRALIFWIAPVSTGHRGEEIQSTRLVRKGPGLCRMCQNPGVRHRRPSQRVDHLGAVTAGSQ